MLGKGRKDRILTIWKEVADSVRAWLAVRGEAPVPELFLNARGKEMTRAGFEYLLRKYAAMACKRCPSLDSKRVSPHVLRHYLPFLTMSCPATPASFLLGYAWSRTDIVLTPLSSPCRGKGVHCEMRHQ